MLYYIIKKLFFLIPFFVAAICYFPEKYVIQTENGPVKGCLKESVEGVPLVKFNIPYAKPPIGRLRFREPQPADKWTEIKQMCDDFPPCVQTLPTGETLGNEDCLYLNVLIRKSAFRSQGLPVYVFIHGGHYLYLDASQCEGDYFAHDNVIFVAIQYRLGVIGFLSTNDSSSYGNWGLKDQRLALRWVYDNIEKFGGDKNKITIGGVSAGSSSVSYLLQSPTTKGLFSGAILHSGTSLGMWTLGINTTKAAFNLGLACNINTTSTKELVAKLRKIDAIQLEIAANGIGGLGVLLSDPLCGVIFAPVKEPNNPRAIFTGESYDILKNEQFHDVPILIGVTSQEVNYYADVVAKFPSDYSSNPDYLVPTDMHITKKSTRKLVGTQINDYYFVNCKNVDNYCVRQFFSDTQFIVPTLKTIQFYSLKEKTYFYVFDYKGPLGGGDLNLYGVGHTEDINYICKTQSNLNISATRQDKIVRRKMLDAWISFLKNRNPSNNWPLTGSRNKYSYMNISTKFNVGHGYRAKILRFWDNLYETYANEPFTTY